MLQHHCSRAALALAFLIGCPTLARADEARLPAVRCQESVDPGEANNACLGCHAGIERIICSGSGMDRALLARAKQTGGNRCLVCHGGAGEARLGADTERGSQAYDAVKERAHGGAAFYPDPGSPWINRHTCGVCHAWQAEAQWQSLMMTEAGKIQGTAWGFGGLTGYRHQWANYAVKNPAPDKMLGTPAFKKYMAALASKEPDVFVDAMTQVPAAPVTGLEVSEDPGKAAFTYIRGECQRCHLGVGGKRRHGDYRGMGCSACHMPYSNAGTYEGGDKTLGTKPGRPLVHTLQSTHAAPVRVGKVRYSGIPVETCTTCHNRGRRIGVSYQGLMETAYPSPWQKDGKPQQKLHGKHYLHLKQDVHASRGMLCQDCHTTLDVHSPNRLIGAISGAVEIECFDCHGTPDRYPWELPLGFGDEYSADLKPGGDAARGVAKEVPPFMRQGQQHAAADGYLLSARGNPLGNVVRVGLGVRVYLASGRVAAPPLLRALVVEGSELSLAGRVAMGQVDSHIGKLECYACHATWAPQCYGCHIKVDYSKAKPKHYDWVALGHAHQKSGLSPEYTELAESMRLRGEISETRSYLRWEDPALAVNGEGRVSPVVPGCQTTATVIDAEGRTVVANHAFRIPDAEGAGKEGQVGSDMSPLHPHTVQAKARSCESCHASAKALGHGISGGRDFADPSKAHVVDLMTAEGEVIPKSATPQLSAMDGIVYDWSRFVTEDGQQVQTVGHHFKLSRPLNDEERSRVARHGVCLSCHSEIPDRSLAVSLLHHVAKAGGMLPETAAQHDNLLRKLLLLSGWGQVLAPVVALVLVVLGVRWVRRRRRID